MSAKGVDITCPAAEGGSSLRWNAQNVGRDARRKRGVGSCVVGAQATGPGQAMRARGGLVLHARVVWVGMAGVHKEKGRRRSGNIGTTTHSSLRLC